MDCNNNIFIGSKILQRIQQKAATERIPLCGSFELTHRCNLRCKHCYLGQQSEIQKNLPSQLTTAEILKFIDEFTAAGCLYLLLTGGEPLLHKDFSVIYNHAIKNGLLIHLFTNGTLVNQEILDLLQAYPPLSIEITLYGATEKTYENVTGVPGSYKKCLQGIEKLLAIGARVKLKTIIMTLNQHEFFAMEQMAKDYGVPFRFDAAIQSGFYGDKTPLNYRLNPEEIADIDFADAERCRGWVEQGAMHNTLGSSDKLYTCGGGISGFHIDPYGNLMPCITAVNYKYDLRNGSFRDGWENFLAVRLAKKAPPEFACAKCDNRFLCNFCPNFFYLENNSETTRSEFLCRLGHARRAKLKYISK